MREDVALFAAIDFAAQLIDGALVMTYGVTATTVLRRSSRGGCPTARS